ncbi:TPA: aldehyde dehydrogenase family protein [Klebsiella aerogenes]|nr:aldehyde dehydrogenase family protein [Klebsiella aerogenes]
MTSLLIDGKLVPGKGEIQPVYNPATGKLICEIPEATNAQVCDAILATNNALVTPKVRSEYLHKLADAILRRETQSDRQHLNKAMGVQKRTDSGS